MVKGIKDKAKFVIQITSSLLIMLFVYTAVSKLIDIKQFERQMHSQAFSYGTAGILIWTIPELEILTSFLLVFDRTRLAGFYISALLLSIFTGYIILVLLHYYKHVPCSCGGVIKALGWKMHLVFNIFFLLLSVLGIYFTYRERRYAGKE